MQVPWFILKKKMTSGRRSLKKIYYSKDSDPFNHALVEMVLIEYILFDSHVPQPQLERCLSLICLFVASAVNNIDNFSLKRASETWIVQNVPAEHSLRSSFPFNQTMIIVDPSTCNLETVPTSSASANAKPPVKTANKQVNNLNIFSSSSGSASNANNSAHRRQCSVAQIKRSVTNKSCLVM